jgi:hypothetical protein
MRQLLTRARSIRGSGIEEAQVEDAKAVELGHAVWYQGQPEYIYIYPRVYGMDACSCGRHAVGPLPG